jgi:soluble lytic murein transglycosylase-like protein
MAGRLAALLVLAAALAATTGLVNKAGGASKDRVAAVQKPARVVAKLKLVCPIPAKYRHAFKYAAEENNIPLPLLYAVARVESNLDPHAHSAAGARGLLQVLPSTGQSLALNIDDPNVNIVAGARYLRAMLDRFKNADLALAAYNAGPTAVAAVGRAPNNASLAYVERVTRVWTDELLAVKAAC